jgi:hypothetical protein
MIKISWEIGVIVQGDLYKKNKNQVCLKLISSPIRTGPSVKKHPVDVFSEGPACALAWMFLVRGELAHWHGCF